MCKAELTADDRGKASTIDQKVSCEKTNWSLSLNGKFMATVVGESTG